MQTAITTPTQPIPIPVPSFDVMRYLAELCAEFGVDPHELAEIDFSRCETPRGTNQKFMAWFKERNVARAFTPESEALFKTLVDLNNTPELQRLKDGVANDMRQAKDYHRALQSTLENIAKRNLELARYDGTKFLDMTEEVKEIVKDGWFTLDNARTAIENTPGRHPCLVFNTSRVFLQWFNARASVNMKVDMGKYQVFYYPRRNLLKVQQLEDNILVGNYFHPHVDDEGSICWGNAFDMQSRAMKEFRPSKALGALRVILETYNDESPYKDINKFNVKRNPHLAEKVNNRQYRDLDDVQWFDVDDIPPRYDIDYQSDSEYHETEDGDEGELARVELSTFGEVDPETDEFMDNGATFIRMRDGTYHDVTGLV
jgi:hypothetical protein